MATLELKSIQKNFEGLRAVKGCSFALEEGTISCLIGPNGAGKTTVFNMITGFIRPDAGSIFLRGEDVTKLAPYEIVRRGIARSWQNVRLFTDLSVLDNVIVAMPRQSGEKLWTVIARWRRQDLEDKANRDRGMQYLEEVGLVDYAKRLAGALSYGQQKRLSLARLMATEGDVLLLDEPLCGTDARSLEQIMGWMSSMTQRGKTLCLVEHNLEVIKQVSDRILFLDQGEVIATGTVDEIRQRPDLSEIYFGKLPTGVQRVA